MSTDLTTTIAGTLTAYESKHETKLKQFEASHGKLVFNMALEDERKKARKDRGEVNKAIKELDDEHDEIKAPFLEASKLIDAKRKSIKDRFLIVADGIGDQLKAHEEAMNAKLLQFSQQFFVTPEHASKDVQAMIDECSAIAIDESFCDKQADAALEKEKALSTLRDLKQQKEKDEELARLQKAEAERQAKEREELIAKEAADKAVKDIKDAADKKAADAAKEAEAQKNEYALSIIQHIKNCALGFIDEKPYPITLLRYELTEKVKITDDFGDLKTVALEEMEKALAALDRAEEAQKVRMKQAEELEQKAAADKAEAEREAEEAKKANQAHRAKIHKQAKESLMKEAGLSSEIATKVVETIRDELITNVSIKY